MTKTNKVNGLENEIRHQADEGELDPSYRIVDVNRLDDWADRVIKLKNSETSAVKRMKEAEDAMVRLMKENRNLQKAKVRLIKKLAYYGREFARDVEWEQNLETEGKHD